MACSITVRKGGGSCLDFQALLELAVVPSSFIIYTRDVDIASNFTLRTGHIKRRMDARDIIPDGH